MLDVEQFLMTLPIMGKGMLGVFLVAGAIILVMYLLNRTTSGKKVAQEK